ncbi:MAG: LysR family transcriptional regulator [Candidatus Saccharimonadales bacterium]|nr:LysR family transcriptional regulator [Candidatus Saccharimonadales bacterium]
MHHELHKFLRIAELGSFTAAAKAMHISQPALSTAIKNLEKDLAIELIVRDPGEFHLTEAGKLVYESGRRVQLQLENLNRQLEDLKQGRTTPTRIGLIDSLAQGLFESPNFDPELLAVVVDNSARLLNMLSTAQLDMVFITKQDEIEESIVASVIGREKFALVTSPQTAGQARQKLKANQLIDFLAYNSESTTFKLIDEAMRQQAFVVSYSLFSTHPELLKAFAAKGKGQAMLPLTMVGREIERKKLAWIKKPQFAREIQCAWRDGTYINNSMRVVIDEVKDLLQ